MNCSIGLLIVLCICAISIAVPYSDAEKHENRKTDQTHEISYSFPNDYPKKIVNSGADIKSSSNEKKGHTAGKGLGSDLGKRRSQKASDGKRKRAFDTSLLEKVDGLLDKVADVDEDSYSQSVASALAQTVA